MAMGVRATLAGGALVEADRGCRRPHAGAVGAAEVGTFLCQQQENRRSQIGYRRPGDRKSQGGSNLDW